MLTDAWSLFSDMSYRSAVDRAYYAMFHAAHAALAFAGVSEPRTHRGLRTVLGKQLILTGTIERQYGRNLAYAQQVREQMTYDVSASPSQEETEGLLEMARAFVDRVQSFVSGASE